MCSTFAEHCWSLPAALLSDLVWCLPALMACSFPVTSFCPGAEEAQVFLSGHSTMPGLKGASGFSCSCLHQCFPELLVVWMCRKAGAWKLWGSSSRKPSQSLFLYSSCSSAKKECTYSAILLCFTFPNLVIKVLAPWHLNCFY